MKSNLHHSKNYKVHNTQSCKRKRAGILAAKHNNLSWNICPTGSAVLVKLIHVSCLMFQAKTKVMQCYERRDESLTCFNIAVCNFLSNILSRTIVKCLSFLSPIPLHPWPKNVNKKNKKQKQKKFDCSWHNTLQIYLVTSGQIMWLISLYISCTGRETRINKWCSCHLYHSIWLWKLVGEILQLDCLADAIGSAVLAVCLYMSSLLCFPTLLSRVLADFRQKVTE